MKHRVVYMGTPEFAVPPLEAVAALEGVEIVSVISQPDRRAGRGRQLQPSAVKARALELDLPVWTPPSLKGDAAQVRLQELAPDVLVVAAYGEILRPAVLEIPPFGAINVHASLLPRHRGAAPVANALLEGDEQTGVTIMLMDAGMDTGPILATRSVRVRPEHTRGSLTEELSHVGAELLAETLPRWLAGEIEATPQDDEQATYSRMLRKEHGALDWTRSARRLANQVRAFDPWPGSYTTWEGQRLKVLRAWPLAEGTPPDDMLPPGVVTRAGERIVVATGEGWLVLGEVQLAGKRAVSAEDFVHGYPSFIGSRLG